MLLIPWLGRSTSRSTSKSINSSWNQLWIYFFKMFTNRGTYSSVTEWWDTKVKNKSRVLFIWGPPIEGKVVYKPSLKGSTLVWVWITSVTVCTMGVMESAYLLLHWFVSLELKQNHTLVSGKWECVKDLEWAWKLEAGSKYTFYFTLNNLAICIAFVSEPLGMILWYSPWYWNLVVWFSAVHIYPINCFHWYLLTVSL